MSLLKRSDNAQAEMAWAERRLFEQNVWHGYAPSNKQDLVGWANVVIADNLDLADNLFNCQCRASEPEYAQTFETLVLSLIPSEGGL